MPCISMLLFNAMEIALVHENKTDSKHHQCKCVETNENITEQKRDGIHGNSWLVGHPYAMEKEKKASIA